ncbi:MAG: GtrA family protein [Clostridium sp.]|nr:GtrA family protein [Clostridium sp.]
MDKLIEKFKNTFLTPQFIKFVCIGIINTFVGTFFSSIYSMFLEVNIAFGFGYVTGLLVSYTLNSIFTFKEKLKIQRFIKFVIASMPNFIIQYIVVLVVINILELHQVIAYGLAAIIGVPVTFILMKIFTFKK